MTTVPKDLCHSEPAPDSSPSVISESTDRGSILSGHSSKSPATLLSDFTLPDRWRPSITNAIKAPTEAEQRKNLTPDVRNAIVRDIVTSMYAYTSKPNKEFCTQVAKLLVAKYAFMKDVGSSVSGYVSFLQMTFICLHTPHGK